MGVMIALILGGPALASVATVIMAAWRGRRRKHGGLRRWSRGIG